MPCAHSIDTPNVAVDICETDESSVGREATELDHASHRGGCRIDGVERGRCPSGNALADILLGSIADHASDDASFLPSKDVTSDIALVGDACPFSTHPRLGAGTNDVGLRSAVLRRCDDLRVGSELVKLIPQR